MGIWFIEADNIYSEWSMKLPYSRFEILGFTKDVIIEENNTDKNFVLRII